MKCQICESLCHTGSFGNFLVVAPQTSPLQKWTKVPVPVPDGLVKLYATPPSILHLGHHPPHITFVKTHQDGKMSGTEALYRSEQISPGSPSRWALLSACLDLPSLATQQESGSVAKTRRSSGTLLYYTDTEETKEWGRDECLSQVRLPRISYRQLFGGRRTKRVPD
jgi:hypothetical protein